MATASTLAIYVIACLTLPFFFSNFTHQTARESTEIARPHGIRQSVMIVTQKCLDPTNNPLPSFAQC